LQRAATKSKQSGGFLLYLVLTDRGVKLILALVSRSNAISRQAAISDLRASYEMMSTSLENRENPTVL
jgi:hypothetical protein